MKVMGTFRLRQMKKWEKYRERERYKKQKELNLKGKPGDVTCLMELHWQIIHVIINICTSFLSFQFKGINKSNLNYISFQLNVRSIISLIKLNKRLQHPNLPNVSTFNTLLKLGWIKISELVIGAIN